MNEQKFDTLLLDYVEGTLPDDQAEQVRDFAASSPEYGEQLAALQEGMQFARHLTLHEPSASLDHAILAMAQQHQSAPAQAPNVTEETPPRWWEVLVAMPSFKPLIAFCTVVFVVGTVFISQNMKQLTDKGLFSPPGREGASGVAALSKKAVKVASVKKAPAQLADDRRQGDSTTQTIGQGKQPRVAAVKTKPGAAEVARRVSQSAGRKVPNQSKDSSKHLNQDKPLVMGMTPPRRTAAFAPPPPARGSARPETRKDEASGELHQNERKRLLRKKRRPRRRYRRKTRPRRRYRSRSRTRRKYRRKTRARRRVRGQRRIAKSPPQKRSGVGSDNAFDDNDSVRRRKRFGYGGKGGRYRGKKGKRKRRKSLSGKPGYFKQNGNRRFRARLAVPKNPRKSADGKQPVRKPKSDAPPPAPPPPVAAVKPTRAPEASDQRDPSPPVVRQEAPKPKPTVQAAPRARPAPVRGPLLVVPTQRPAKQDPLRMNRPSGGGDLLGSGSQAKTKKSNFQSFDSLMQRGQKNQRLYEKKSRRRSQSSYEKKRQQFHFSRAFADYQRSLRLARRNRETSGVRRAVLALGKLFLRAGRTSQAAGYFREYINTFPRSQRAGVSVQVSRLFSQRGYTRQARDFLPK